MDDSKWERRANLGGIFFVVCVAISALLPGSPPKTSDTGSKIANFLADKSSELRWSAFIGGLAVLGLFWWLGSVYRLIRRAEGGSPRLAVIAVASAVFASVLAAIGGIMLGALPIVGARVLGPTGGRIFYIISTNLGIGTLVGAAVFLGAFSAVIIRSRVLPVWLGWIGALVAVVSVAGSAAVATTRDAVFYVAFTGFIAFLVWTLVVSILMLRGGVEPAAAAAAAAADAASAG
jgi:hypothetical protein